MKELNYRTKGVIYIGLALNRNRRLADRSNRGY